MTKPLQIEKGRVFGKLTTVRSIMVPGKAHSMMECRCSCGQVVTVRRSALLAGGTTSCGCKRWRKHPYPSKLSFEERVVLNKLLEYPGVFVPHSDPDVHIANRLMARGMLSRIPGLVVSYAITPLGRKAHTPRTS